jgi:hypothetical protein
MFLYSLKAQIRIGHKTQRVWRTRPPQRSLVNLDNLGFEAMVNLLPPVEYTDEYGNMHGVGRAQVLEYLNYNITVLLIRMALLNIFGSIVC